MLPMGTIVTCCMFAGLLFGANIPLMQNCPGWIRKTVAVIVMAAGLWNVLWYALQHPAEFWGLAALASGILMILTSLYILDWQRLPEGLRKFKPVALVILLGYALMYTVNIVGM